MTATQPASPLDLDDLIVLYRRQGASVHTLQQALRYLQDALDLATEARADTEAELAAILLERGPYDLDDRRYEGVEAEPGLLEVSVMPIDTGTAR